MSIELEPQPLSARALEAILEPATAVVLAWIAAVGLVVHSDPLLATLVVLGATGAFLAGLLGVGGAIVMIPLLVYVPPAIGTGQLTMHDIAGITMVQVFAAAASGVAGHVRAGNVDKRVVAVLGLGMMAGSLGGGAGSRLVSSSVLQGAFAGMAAAGALMMVYYASRQPGPPSEWLRRWRKQVGFAISLPIGLVAGAVGAGGAILLIPVMLHVLKTPARVVVGSSLAIVLLGAASGVVGKLVTDQIPGWPALALVAGALPAAQLGAAVSHRLRVRHLERLLAALIVGVAIKMWWDILA